MQLVTVNSWIYFFFDCFFRGFTLYTLLCMMLRLLPNPVWRKEADKINAAKNLLMPVAAVVAVISILIIIAESDQAMPEDQFAFVQVKWEFEMVELVTAFLSWAIMLSFCWPHPRKSWWLSMISLLLLKSLYNKLFYNIFQFNALESHVSYTAFIQYTDSFFIYHCQAGISPIVSFI